MDFQFGYSGKYWIMFKPRLFVGSNIQRLRDAVKYCIWVEKNRKEDALEPNDFL